MPRQRARLGEVSWSRAHPRRLGQHQRERLRAEGERRGDRLTLPRGPAIRQPQPRVGIAAIVDEGVPLGIGDQPVGEREGLEQQAVRRALVVEGEARFLVPDAGDPAGVFVPAGACPGTVTQERRVLAGKLPQNHHTRQLLARSPYAA